MKKSVVYVLPWLLMACLLIACGDVSGPENANPEASSVVPQTAGACQEPRPEICTLQYDPVCGHGEAEPKTYSTACTACADPAIQGWVRGAC